MPGSPHETCDVLVVGSTPAAATAAIRARQLGLGVVRVSQAPAAESGDPACWVNRDCVKLCESIGLSRKAIGASKFSGLSLYSPDFRRQTSVEADGIGGWLATEAAMRRALLSAADAAGAKAINGTICGLDVGDRDVVATLADGGRIEVQVVLTDDGVDSAAAALVRLEAAGTTGRSPRCVCLTTVAPSSLADLNVILNAGHNVNIGYVVRVGKRAHVGMLSRTLETPIETQFAAFRDGLETAGLISSGGKRTVSTFASPAGVAIDMHSHVGKRMLLIGESGGFVAAFSNGRLYAAMRSGWLAAETAAQAIAAPVLQDALATFESAWRTELANYLRLPNTDLSLLMPLVFSENKQMARRVARAFLLGEHF